MKLDTHILVGLAGEIGKRLVELAIDQDKVDAFFAEDVQAWS